MKFNLINRLGDWNPQLLRELKGSLNSRNVLLATAISLFGQFILFMSFQIKLPTRNLISIDYFNKYCTGVVTYSDPKCLTDGLDNVIVNWQLWSSNFFCIGNA